MLYDKVFWDWNGTLLDDVGACVEAINVSLRERSMPLVDVKAYSEGFRFPVRDYYVTMGFDLERESYADLAVEFTENYLKANKGLRTGAKKVLEKLFLNSVPQYILSACEKNILSAGVKEYGIGCFFKDLIALDNNRAGSKLAVGRAYLEDNKIDGKILMVGDTEHDYEVASALGMDCVLLYSGYNSLARLRATGCRIIEDISELPELVLGKRTKKPTDYMTPEKAERRSFDLSETDKKFKEKYRAYYNDVKNTNATEDW